ncbi:MAG TPA: calcium-binding protein [Syntrophorhabdaceae bacterium]|nr:calcium-binding protein [Syntrophorhabdaceae bacterium]
MSNNKKDTSHYEEWETGTVDMLQSIQDAGDSVGLDGAIGTYVSGPLYYTGILTGTKGKDIEGDLEPNRLVGTGGDDTIRGWADNDTIFGGAGDDRIRGDNHDDILFGGSGNDGIAGDDGSDKIYGQSGDDRLFGGDGYDWLEGNIGADYMEGGDGNDTLYGDDSSIIFITAGDGMGYSGDYGLTLNYNDTIEGGSGKDELFGGTGNDRLYGNTGNDTLYGDTGNDFLNGGNDDDRIYGGHGNDTLEGNPGNDTLYGNEGDDTLDGRDGGSGTDVMYGGAGNDTYYVDRAKDSVVEFADEGIDTVYSSITFVLGDTLENLILTGNDAINGTGNAFDNLIIGNGKNNILYGGDGNDILDGWGGNDILEGWGGNDLLFGENGNDKLYGGAGNDILNGGFGRDTMYGGAGDDTYYVLEISDVVIETTLFPCKTSGIDTVVSSIDYALGDLLENLVLQGHAIAGGGNASDNVIIGNTKSNALYGYDGDDTIDGGIGTDTMYGGYGNDTYCVDEVSDLVIERAGQGIDTVCSPVTYTLGDDVEHLNLTGTAAINGFGNDLDNLIAGNDANNLLYGFDGNDTLSGGDGSDMLLGGDGNDYLSGGAGDDLLAGGDGNDTLSGGDGSDTYQFIPGGGSDRIDDAGSARDTDMLQLSRSVPRDMIAFFKDGRDLHIAYGDRDYITVLNQDTEGIEMIQTGGWHLTDTDINAVIQQITAYSADHGITLTSAHDVRNNGELMNIIVNAWHQ